MYVCICHGLTDRKIREAISRGSATPADVYRYFGVTPQCGKCLPSIREMLVETNAKELLAAE